MACWESLRVAGQYEGPVSVSARDKKGTVGDHDYYSVPRYCRPIRFGHHIFSWSDGRWFLREPYQDWSDPFV
jgi:hypothetical protein